MKPDDELNRSESDFLTARFVVLLLKKSGFQASEIVEMETSLTKVLRHHVDFTRLQEGIVVPNPDDPCRERRCIGRARPKNIARVHETLTRSERITTSPSNPTAENANAVCPGSEPSHGSVLAPSQLARCISSSSVDGPFVGNQSLPTLNGLQNENSESKPFLIYQFLKSSPTTTDHSYSKHTKYRFSSMLSNLTARVIYAPYTNQHPRSNPPQILPSHVEGHISIHGGCPLDSSYHQFSSGGT